LELTRAINRDHFLKTDTDLLCIHVAYQCRSQEVLYHCVSKC